MRLRLVLTVIAALACVALGPEARSATGAGDLDRSFGRRGLAVARFEGAAYPSDMVVDDKGRIYVVGWDRRVDRVAVARFTPNGRLDPSFGGDGRVLRPFGERPRVTAAALTSTGELVVVGWEDGAIDAIRLQPNGSFDRSFGADGRVQIPYAPYPMVNAVLPQHDGGLVLAGGDPTSDSVALWRLLPDGSLDRSFGTNGVVVTESPTAGHLQGAIAIAGERHGAFVVATGVYRDGLDRFAILRYRADGSLDSRFGSRGMADPVLGSRSAVPVAIMVDDRERTTVVGSYGSLHVVGLVRLSPSGRLDDAFSGDGRLLAAVHREIWPADATLDSHGDVVVGGLTQGGEGIVRVTPRGRLDRSFGSYGMSIRHRAGFAVYAVGVQPRGDIVALCAVFHRSRPDPAVLAIQP